jgi:hypothetical protein
MVYTITLCYKKNEDFTSRYQLFEKETFFIQKNDFIVFMGMAIPIPTTIDDYFFNDQKIILRVLSDAIYIGVIDDSE